jgi:hypothetical protein
MIGNVSPIEAVRTVQGRKKLEELLALYDNMRRQDSEFIDVNIPSGYARWKLGYGPGSEAEFAEEEGISNFMSVNSDKYRPTQRKERHTEKLEKKIVSIYIPRRCEYEGCDKRGYGDKLKSCSRCNCSFYCGKEQLQISFENFHRIESVHVRGRTRKISCGMLSHFVLDECCQRQVFHLSFKNVGGEHHIYGML